MAYGALACVRSGTRQLDRGLAVRADQPGIFRKRTKKEVAAALFLGEGAVATHLTHGYPKLPRALTG